MLTGGAILALDTSTLTQTVFASNGEDRSASRTFHAKRGHTSSLLLSLEAVLHEVGLAKTDLDLIAVGLGPGSFTGLRIGLAAAKALAFTTATDIVGVSSLAAMARAAASATPVHADPTFVATATDARKREVYAALWRVDAGAEPSCLLAENTYDPGNFAEAVRGVERGRAGLLAVGSGFGQYETVFREAWTGCDVAVLPQEHWAPRAEHVAHLGRMRWNVAGSDELGALEPRYIRPSEAELNWRKQ